MNVALEILMLEKSAGSDVTEVSTLMVSRLGGKFFNASMYIMKHNTMVKS